MEVPNLHRKKKNLIDGPAYKSEFLALWSDRTLQDSRENSRQIQKSKE